MRFRKKPVVIEAIQWNGSNFIELLSLYGESIHGAYEISGHRLLIPTPEGNHIANIGDWIIKGIKGESYPCKPDVFAQTYEEVRE